MDGDSLTGYTYDMMNVILKPPKSFSGIRQLMVSMNSSENMEDQGGI
jgi:hypothetical protein